jgi:hypothetical protein
MSSLSTHALVGTDETYDRANASDGVSRYGAYLSQRAHLFTGVDGGPPDVVTFTVLAWRIACPPVMSPGYVRRRSGITGITLRHCDEPDVLVADVEVRLPWPAGLRPWDGPLNSWRDWQSHHGRDDQEPHRLAPRDDDKPALLHTAHLWLPIRHTDLPEPRLRVAGDIDTDDAKRAVRGVCSLVNEVAGPVVELVRDGQR